METEDTLATGSHTADTVDSDPTPGEAKGASLSRPTETWGGPTARVPSALLPEGAQVRLGEASELTVLREVGRGGMGTVYLVRDRRLGREAALKVVRDPTPDRVARFRRESEITSRLSHPAIPPVYDAGQTEGGLDYLLMRYVSGRSLAERFARYHERRTRRSLSGRDMPLPRDLLEVLVTISEALAYAHSRGVLHRDLKPTNVLLGPFGETVLLDWGLALELGAPGAGASEMVGTVGYMAPEQARGEPVDERADVFGLGALLAEALTSRLPVEGEDAGSVLGRLRRGEIRRPSQLAAGVPPELDAIAACALAPIAEDRYSSAEAFGDDLRAFLAGRPVSVYRESVLRRARRWLAQHPTLTVALILGTVGALLIARARAWERAELVQEAQQEVRMLRQGELREAPDPLGQAWGTVSAARRWVELAPDDPDARRAMHNASLHLGDLALESGQLTLARRAYREGVGLGVDDRLLGQRLEQIAMQEAAEAEYRADRIRFALEQIGDAEVPPQIALDELVFQGATAAGLRQLVRSLDLAADDLAWAEVRLLLGGELGGEADRIVLHEALVELRELAPGEVLLQDHESALGAARARAVEAARRAGSRVGSYWELLDRQQRDVCVDSRRRGAALLSVFRRLVRLGAVRKPVFRYGRFVGDPRLAQSAADLLLDLGLGARALQVVERFGADSEAFLQVQTRLASGSR